MNITDMKVPRQFQSWALMPVLTEIEEARFMELTSRPKAMSMNFSLEGRLFEAQATELSAFIYRVFKNILAHDVGNASDDGSFSFHQPSILSILATAYCLSRSVPTNHSEGASALEAWSEHVRRLKTNHAIPARISEEEAQLRLSVMLQIVSHLFSRCDDLVSVAFFGGFLRGRQIISDLDVMTFSQGEPVSMPEWLLAKEYYELSLGGKLSSHGLCLMGEDDYLEHNRTAYEYWKKVSNPSPSSSAQASLGLALAVEDFCGENPDFGRLCRCIQGHTRDSHATYDAASSEDCSRRLDDTFGVHCIRHPYDKYSAHLSHLTGSVLLFIRSKREKGKNFAARVFFNSCLQALQSSSVP